MANQNLERVFHMKPSDVIRVDGHVIKYAASGLYIAPYEGYCTAALDDGDTELWRMMNFIAKLGSYPADLREIFGGQTQLEHVPESWLPVIGFLKNEFPKGITVENAMPYLTDHAFKADDENWLHISATGTVMLVESKGGLTGGVAFRDFVRQVPIGANVHDYPAAFVEVFLRDTYPDVTDAGRILCLGYGNHIEISNYRVLHYRHYLTSQKTSAIPGNPLSIVTLKTLEYLCDKKVHPGKLRSWLYENKFFCLNPQLAKLQQ